MFNGSFNKRNNLKFELKVIDLESECGKKKQRPKGSVISHKRNMSLKDVDEALKPYKVKY